MPFHWWNIKIHTPRMFSGHRRVAWRRNSWVHSQKYQRRRLDVCVCLVCVCVCCVCGVCCILLCGVFSRSFGPVNKFLRSIQKILFSSPAAHWTWPEPRDGANGDSSRQEELAEEPSKSVPSGRKFICPHFFVLATTWRSSCCCCQKWQPQSISASGLMSGGEAGEERERDLEREWEQSSAESETTAGSSCCYSSSRSGNHLALLLKRWFMLCDL